MTEVWTKWESQVVNGVFPLRRFLGRSDHSVVFLTESNATDCPSAAIKLVPADPVLAEAQLAQWRTAAALSHPHLIRLLDAGRCRLGGHQFLFIVMEYAEQTLAQILPHRALTPDEVREMLIPALDALAFLHQKNLVQGQLKPPNFLVVNDQLKLASDTVRRAGESIAGIAKPSVYDPPEAKDGRIPAAGDIWALGITIVEALTQSPPAGSGERSETASLPPTLPQEFVDIVRGCLSRNPADRPTITDLQLQIKQGPQASVVSAPKPPVRQAASRVTPPEKAPKSRWVGLAVAGVLLIVLAVSAGLRLLERPPDPQQPTTSQASEPPQVAESLPPASRHVSRPSEQTASPSDVSPSVLHQEIPDVSRSARGSIRGRIKVAVRVTVDHSGNVISETVTNPGSSRYFTRVSAAAARKWKFAPADSRNSREWLLQFEFTRGGTTASAAPRP